jgi:endonuclease/exonuclease/phosphatase (EEP) superfamily protein YafD
MTGQDYSRSGRTQAVSTHGQACCAVVNRRRIEVALAWIAVIPLLAWAVIRLFGLDGGFPLEALMPFTPYVAAGSVAVVAFALALRVWPAAGVAAVAALCLGALVLPRQFETETVSAAGHRTLRVLAANVYLGRADPAGFMRLVDELHPDVITIEELTPRFRREVAAAGLDSRYRFHVLDPGLYARGTGIFSRFPLRRLPAPVYRSGQARAEASLPGGGRLRIVAAHPYPPDLPSATPEWEEVLEALPSTGRGTPWLLAGDFNATFDQAPFRDLVSRGYRDAGKATGKGLDGTYPGDGSLFPPPITIDHILADRRLGVVSYEVEPLPGSDHHAIFAELTLPDR